MADLIGLKVEDETGQLLGELTDVLQTGANDVYVIRLDEGGELLLPAIKQCILDVDVETGVMKVHVLEGL
jgi:16S rRNA processing protein RimM